MKKIALGFCALFLVFSSIAQSTEKTYRDSTNKHQQGSRLKKDDFEKLNLTDEQKAQMKTINQNFKQELADANKNEGTPDEQKAKRKELMKEHRQKMMAVLTPEQKKQVKDLRKENKEKDHLRKGKQQETTTN